MSETGNRQFRLVDAPEVNGALADVIFADVKALGFEFYAFGMKAPHPLTAQRVALCSNHPSEWLKWYQSLDYLQCDPTVLHGIKSTQPLLWSDELFSACPEFLSRSRSFGLHHGCTFPYRDSHGMVSLLSLARRAPAISAVEWQVIVLPAIQLAQRCHESMLSVWQNVLSAGVNHSLVEREADVLRWSADGKTSADVAQILGIAEATVNFHANNAAKKLGTSNRIATAVRAALMGLI